MISWDYLRVSWFCNSCRMAEPTNPVAPRKRAAKKAKTVSAPAARKRRSAPPAEAPGRVTAMSDEHKHALAVGREEGRAVRTYLEALEAHKPRRGRKRTGATIDKRLEQIERDLPTRTRSPGFTWSKNGSIFVPSSKPSPVPST